MMEDKTKEMAVALQQAIDKFGASPFPGLSFAGEMDDLLELALEITMNEKWIGYLNARVLGHFNRLYPGRLTHLQFIPDLESGMAIMVPTSDENAYGAMAVDYKPSENAAVVNLRLAVKRLKVVPQRGRVHQFPVVERPAPNGTTYLAFVTKGAATKPTTRRKSKSSPEQAAQTGTTPPVAPQPQPQPEKAEGTSQTASSGK